MSTADPWGENKSASHPLSVTRTADPPGAALFQVHTHQEIGQNTTANSTPFLRNGYFTQDFDERWRKNHIKYTIWQKCLTPLLAPPPDVSISIKHQQREEMEMSLINVEKENVEEEKEQGNEKCFPLKSSEPNIIVG